MYCVWDVIVTIAINLCTIHCSCTSFRYLCFPSLNFSVKIYWDNSIILKFSVPCIWVIPVRFTALLTNVTAFQLLSLLYLNCIILSFRSELFGSCVSVAVTCWRLLWIILSVLLCDCIWLSKEFEWVESKLSESELESVWLIFDELDSFSLSVSVLSLDGYFVVAIGFRLRVI